MLNIAATEIEAVTNMTNSLKTFWGYLQWLAIPKDVHGDPWDTLDLAYICRRIDKQMEEIYGYVDRISDHSLGSCLHSLKHAVQHLCDTLWCKASEERSLKEIKRNDVHDEYCGKLQQRAIRHHFAAEICRFVGFTEELISLLDERVKAVYNMPDLAE